MNILISSDTEEAQSARDLFEAHISIELLFLVSWVLGFVDLVHVRALPTSRGDIHVVHRT